MSARVAATETAKAAIARLIQDEGRVTFFQSGGCCDGSSPICLHEGALASGPHDRLLGEVAGAPFYIDAEQDDRWNRPLFVLDLAPGPPEGFSLPGPDGTHFVTRSGAECEVSGPEPA